MKKFIALQAIFVENNIHFSISLILIFNYNDLLCKSNDNLYIWVVVALFFFGYYKDRGIKI